MERQHWLVAKLASPALIRLRRISKAIAKDDFSLGNPRLNDFGDVLRPRREHQSQLGERSQGGGFRIQQELPNLFSRWRAARLSSHHHGQALRAQDSGKLR